MMFKQPSRHLSDVLKQYALWVFALETEGTPIDGKRAILAGADLSGLQLSGVILTAAYLYETNFMDSDLPRGQFQWADLRLAQIRGANFTKADFSGAWFTRTDFTDVNLTNTILTDCEIHLDGTKRFIQFSDVNGAIKTVNGEIASYTEDDFQKAIGA